MTKGAEYSAEDKWTSKNGDELEGHIEAEISGVFASAKTGGSVKLTTGYEWGEASKSTFKESIKIEMKDTVPKGRKLKINTPSLILNP